MKIFFIFFFVLLIGGSLFYFREKTEKQEPLPNPMSETPKQPEASERIPSVHPDSILNMSQKEYQGSDLKLEKVLAENEKYTRHHITYKSEGLTISGIMNIPKGKGPFPMVILNHGYIDPKFYTNGQGLKREQDFLARNGYAVLHSDYRNYAQSDFDAINDLRPRSGYVEDVINAIEAIKKSDLPIDKENIGMLGHSLGGGIAINIMTIKPEIAKAYVLLAPINSDYRINFDKWVRNDWSDVAGAFIEKYGAPEENPELWYGLSAKNYLSRVSSPVQLHQGTDDNQVPLEWSKELAKLLQKEKKDITYYEYPGEGHTFISAQEIVMRRTLDFLDANLKN